MALAVFIEPLVYRFMPGTFSYLFFYKTVSSAFPVRHHDLVNQA